MAENRKKEDARSVINTGGQGKQKAGSGKKPAASGKNSPKKVAGKNAAVKNKGKKGASSARSKGQQDGQGIPMSNEIMLIASFGILLIMMFSNFGYCGTAGEWLANFFFGIFGCIQYVMPVVFFLGMTILIANDYSTLAMKKCGAGFIIAVSVSAFAQLLYEGKEVTVHDLFSLAIDNHATGGIVGGGIALMLKNGFGTAGAVVILFCIVLLALVLLTQRSFVAFFRKIVVGIHKNYSAWRAEVKRKREERKKAEPKGKDIHPGEEEEAPFKKATSFLKMKSGRKTPADKLRAKQCEEKVRELENRKAQAKTERTKKDSALPETIPEVNGDGEILAEKEKTSSDTAAKKQASAGNVDDIKIHVPLFTSSDEVKRKDSVRELHPKIYPFTEEDGKTEPFQGELDFSAFHFRKDGEESEEAAESVPPELSIKFSGQEQFVPPYKGKGGFQTSLPEEIRAESAAADDVTDLAEGRDSEQKLSAEAVGVITISADDIAGEAVVDETVQPVPVQEIEMPEEAGAAEQSEESENPEETDSVKESENVLETVAAEEDEDAPQLPDSGSVGVGGEKREAPKAADRKHKARKEKRHAPEKKMVSHKEISKEVPAVKPKAEGAVRRQKVGTAEYIYPPISLLTKEEQTLSPDYDKHLRETARKLQQTLESFGVRVTITDISCGPTVTRYEMFPEQGTKVSKIVSLTDDIKLNLAASDIRIEAPIPGKAAVGIEVPNKHNMTVHFRDLAESRIFRKFKSKLAFAVGKDIGGKTVVADLARMPHLLIAGATGSGKSVCINTLIMSLLYKATPEEVKLIMIDPKMVELSIYNGIPHLLIPVVTDPKKASGALNWAVAEMTQRYKKFTETGVRNIEGYNKKVKELVESGEVSGDDLKKMPQIVIIVDELADLMMVAPGEVEDAIVRLSQLARAAGLHLVIATQRPSVNVITGLIKANVPSRIAFSVSSGVDSRTIIDMNGAEKLLGKGDMLFYPAGYQKPVRVQGAFVSDQEISRVVEFLKENEDVAVYDKEATENIETKLKNNAVSQERDEYFEAAARFIMEKDKATIGMLQRMFKIGFNRAARIIDQLADAGIVGPEEGTKPRKILMTPEQLDAYFEENL